MTQSSSRLSFRRMLVVVTKGLNRKCCSTCLNRKFLCVHQPTWTTPYDLYISYWLTLRGWWPPPPRTSGYVGRCLSARRGKWHSSAHSLVYTFQRMWWKCVQVDLMVGVSDICLLFSDFMLAAHSDTMRPSQRSWVLWERWRRVWKDWNKPEKAPPQPPQPEPTVDPQMTARSAFSWH